MNEKEVEEKLRGYLIEKGFELKKSVKVKGRYPDVVAVKNGKVYMFEVKGGMGDITAGTAAAIDFRSGSNFSFLALPIDRISEKEKQTMENLGLGLVGVGDEIKFIVIPKRSEMLESVKERVLETPKQVEERGVPSRPGILAEVPKHKRIVSLLLRYPERNFTIRELSELSRTPYANTWRFVRKLYASGIILQERIGPSISCRLNTAAPFLKEIEKLLEIEASFHLLAAKGFVGEAKGVGGIETIILFGSAARGEAVLDSDVDVLVITEKKDKALEEKIKKIAEKILETHRVKVMPILLIRKELEKDEQFKKEIEKGKVLYARD